MMKKNAFTLAEVLIVLGIIGIVSALTIPSLVTNVNSNKIGPQLSAFTSIIENGVQNYLADEGKSKLDDANEFNRNVMGHYIESISKEGAISDGVWKRTYVLSNGQILRVEDIYTTNHLRVTRSGGSVRKAGPEYLKGTIAKLVLLINSKGEKDSNGNISFAPSTTTREGYQLFYFYLDKSGTVVPWGSSMCNTSYSYPGGDDYYGDRCRTGYAKGCAGFIKDNNWSTNGIDFYRRR